VCVNKLVIEGVNDIKTTNKDLFNQLHPEKNKNLNISTISTGSHKKVWWICEKGHEWQTSVEKRSKNNNNCPICLNKKLLTGFNDVLTKDKKLANQWHPKLNRLKPDKVIYGSHLKIWWLCEKGHEWQAKISNRIIGTDCPFCNSKKIQINENDLKTKFPLISNQWNYKKNINLRPEQFLPGSNTRVWWVCEKGHEWRTQIIHRTRGSNCPYCNNKKILTNYNDLAFLNPEILKMWNYKLNNKVNPSLVSPGSHIQVWWICQNGHQWKSQINYMVKTNKCPKCSKKIKII